MDPNTPDSAKELGVGMVGHAFMGAAHSQAWRTAPRFFDLPLHPRMRALCGRDADRVAAAAVRLGWESTETDWRRLLARPDIDLVDVCTPGDTHAEIAVAALEAGKHVLCEKPLANTVAEAQAMTAAADRAAANGVLAMVGFTYRRVPAIAISAWLSPGVHTSTRSMSSRLSRRVQSVSVVSQPRRAAASATRPASRPHSARIRGFNGRSKKRGADRQACEWAAPMKA